MISRTLEEIQHWLRKDWTFEDVGRHWDHTEDYDHINEETYSYYRRFIDGARLSSLNKDSHVLDFCSRTGNGTLHFYKHGKIASSVCADVSEKMGAICRRHLQESGMIDFSWVKITGPKLPFQNGEFDGVLCFETVEHFPDPATLIRELGRVTKEGGEMILTTPNVLWEPVHAIAAITKLHHSEGPHRFIRYGKLWKMIEEAGFEVEKAETTVLVPAGPDFLVKTGEWIEQRTKNTLMPLLGLRRVAICRRV